MAEPSSAPPDLWTWAALAASGATVAGSLYLSLGMDLLACPLCFYQRTFAMSVVGVLAIGLLTGAARGGVLSLLALPAGVGGLGVAAFHVFLELNGTLECPAGVLGVGTAPQQSLAALAVVVTLLVRDALAARGQAGLQMPAFLSSLVLGGLFAWGCVAGSPPLPKVPEKPYDAPLKVCRPPYRAAS